MYSEWIFIVKECTQILILSATNICAIILHENQCSHKKQKIGQETKWKTKYIIPHNKRIDLFKSVIPPKENTVSK